MAERVAHRVMFVGIDAGGSKTAAALVDGDGRVVALGRGGPSNHLSGNAGRERMRQAVTDALKPLLAETIEAEISLHAGLSGISVPDKQRNFEEALEGLLAPTWLSCSDDAEIALEGAAAGGPGVVVIAGTGSIALGRATDGRKVRVGGYGYLLGDEGSGFDLGRRGLMAALQAADGRGPSTILVERLSRVLAVEDVRQAPGLLYGSSREVEALAALAPTVLAAAADGDVVAGAIVESAGKCLAALAAAVARRLNEPLLVFGTGSLLGNSQQLRVAFDAALRATDPPLRYRPSRLSPLGGAVLLAMRRAGHTPSLEVIERLEAELS